jgi:NAD(P)-dependent dehydrogenase (short-subunit alcohol dehydrogenase family)
VGALDGKVAVVTGAGRGIGRGEALALAAEGASVVVNDLGGTWDGTSADDRPASEVVAEIRSRGGAAVANFSDVADAAGAQSLIDQAIETFGDLHILVNNAGILRDGMIFSIEPESWETVVRVHLMGHFLPTRAAAAYWRNRAKQDGVTGQRAVINTTSESGLFGNAGQSNYDAAKMGIVSLTMAVAKETAKYGVTVNAIAPRARTRLTTTTFESTGRAAEFADAEVAAFDAMDPDNIGPFVAFLSSEAAAGVTGQTFIVYGGVIGRVRMPHLAGYVQTDGRWTVADLAMRSEELFKDVGRDVFEGPKGYARLPRQ